MELLDAFGQRRIEQCRRGGPDQSAEFRNDAGRACRLLAPRLDIADIDRKAVALLGALDRDRSALRIEVGEVQFSGGAVAFAGEHAAEGVFRLHDHHPAWVDRQGRLRIGTVDVVEGALLLDRQTMGCAGCPLCDRALGHDGILQPVFSGHANRLLNSDPGMTLVPVSHALEGVAGANETDFVEVTADELKADRTAIRREASGQRHRRASRHVEWACEAEQSANQRCVLAQRSPSWRAWELRMPGPVPR